jgi:ubiquinone/menaquinone biosynthesis C-methylase UbiE
MAREWKGERLETFVYNEATVEHLHRYSVAYQLINDKDVLDLACGEGYGSNILSACAKSVTGIDSDNESIANASRKYKKSNLRFLTANAVSLPLPDHSIDVVVSFETIEHLSEHEKMLMEIKRVLRAKGTLIISTPDKKNYSDRTGFKNPYHVKELYANEFKKLIATYFLNCRYLYQMSTYTSIIAEDNKNDFQLCTGNFESVTSLVKLEPFYVIGIASDGHLPSVSPSIFLGNSIFQTAIRDKESEIKRTLSYQIGHLLLLPLKLIRNAFR